MLIEIKGMALKGSRILEGALAVISDPLFTKEDPDRRKIRGRKRKLVRAGVTQRTKVKPSIDRDCPDVLAGATGRAANRLELRAACLTLIWPRSTHTHSSPGCSLLHEQEKALGARRDDAFSVVSKDRIPGRATARDPSRWNPTTSGDLPSEPLRAALGFVVTRTDSQRLKAFRPRSLCRWAIDLEVREFSNLPMLR